MNLFTFRKMEEDHYTNILMYILTSNNHLLLPYFIEGIFANQSHDFEYEDLEVDVFKKSSARGPKPFEYIIGIAPFSSEEKSDSLINNVDSIPDAWIYGRNFTLLLEFKIRGTLDEGQLAAHKMKLSNCLDIIRLEWEDVINVLETIVNKATDIQKFLIEEFIISSLSFNVKRQSSGMPKEIIGGRNKSNELHFVITGSKQLGEYHIDVNYPDGRSDHLINVTGIQEARKWIANYVVSNSGNLPLDSIDNETIISDLCVKPGRIKDAWNQWRIGSYL